MIVLPVGDVMKNFHDQKENIFCCLTGLMRHHTDYQLRSSKKPQICEKTGICVLAKQRRALQCLKKMLAKACETSHP